MICVNKKFNNSFPNTLKGYELQVEIYLNYIMVIPYFVSIYKSLEVNSNISIGALTPDKNS